MNNDASNTDALPTKFPHADARRLFISLAALLGALAAAIVFLRGTVPFTV